MTNSESKRISLEAAIKETSDRLATVDIFAAKTAPAFAPVPLPPVCPGRALEHTMNTDSALWTVLKKFGVAGGPDEIVLSEEGQARAFSVGAQVRRGAPASALELLWSHQGEGLLSMRKPGSSRLQPTDLGKIDQITWGHLRALGYVESFGRDGVRLTETGKAAARSGLEERKRLLDRCVEAVRSSLEDPSK